MATPKPGESETDFMGRCVPQLVGEGRTREQATAMCASAWDDEKAPSGEVHERGRRTAQAMADGLNKLAAEDGGFD